MFLFGTEQFIKLWSSIGSHQSSCSTLLFTQYFILITKIVSSQALQRYDIIWRHVVETVDDLKLKESMRGLRVSGTCPCVWLGMTKCPTIPCEFESSPRTSWCSLGGGYYSQHFGCCSYSGERSSILNEALRIPEITVWGRYWRRGRPEARR